MGPDIPILLSCIIKARLRVVPIPQLRLFPHPLLPLLFNLLQLQYFNFIKAAPFDNPGGLYFNNDNIMNSFFPTLAHLTETRPTLPPLHSLNLPIPRISQGRAGAATMNTSPTNDLNEIAYASSNAPRWGKTRSFSNSSASFTSSTASNSSNSRTPSPTPSETSLTSTSSTRSSGSFRLIPCEMENADAVVLVTESTDGSSRTQALLLVGPAVQPYRQPSTRPVAKNARVHPYKIAPSQSLSRRSSMLSISSQLN